MLEITQLSVFALSLFLKINKSLHLKWKKFFHISLEFLTRFLTNKVLIGGPNIFTEMFSLRLVFLAMVISMTLSTVALGGGSPNDKMDTILSVVYSMRDRMDNLVGKVGNMESKVNNIDNMEELTAEKVIIHSLLHTRITQLCSTKNIYPSWR